MALPGISFEVARAAPPPLGIRTDRVALIALTERGPVETPTLIAGPDPFVTTFGCPLPGTLGALAAHQAFENGAEELVVTRFVPTLGASAATGELPLTSGSVLPLRLREPGAFGNRVSVLADVKRLGAREGTQLAPDRLDLSSASEADEGRVAFVHGAVGDQWVRIDGVAGTVVQVSPALPAGGSAVLVELFDPIFDLRVREPSRADRIIAGLDLRFAEDVRSRLRGTPLALDTTSPTLPDALPLPGSVVPLSGGDDGLQGIFTSDPSHQNALSDSFLACLDALALSDLPDILIAPDLWSRIWRTKGVQRLAFDPDRASRLADAMIRHAARARDRVVIVDPPLTGFNGLEPVSLDTIEEWRLARQNSLGADRDFAALPFPWLRVESDVAFRGDVTLRGARGSGCSSISIGSPRARTSRIKAPTMRCSRTASLGYAGTR